MAQKTRGAVLIRVRRPGLSAVREHESEAHADTLDVDSEIINDGDLLDLQRKIAALEASYATHQATMAR